MFSGNSCEGNDGVPHYEESQVISSHDIVQQLDLTEANVQGSYVSLLADTSSVDKTNELNDSVQYSNSVNNFTDKDSEMVTLPTSLQSESLITYENQNLGYNLTSQPGNSQCLSQFVIFQSLGPSVITQAVGNNALFQMPSSVETQHIVESNQELEDAVANISGNSSVGSKVPDTTICTDQSYIVSTNNHGEIQNIQVVPAATLQNEPMPKKQKLSKTVKKKKSPVNVKPKEKASEVKKFTVEELTSEVNKTKQQLCEEFIGMTEQSEKSKKNTEKVHRDNNCYTKVPEPAETNENITDVIHVRIEKPADFKHQNDMNNENDETISTNILANEVKGKLLECEDYRVVQDVGTQSSDDADASKSNTTHETSTQIVFDKSSNIAVDMGGVIGASNTGNGDMGELTYKINKIEHAEQCNKVNEANNSPVKRDWRDKERTSRTKHLIKSKLQGGLKRKGKASGKSSISNKKDPDNSSRDTNVKGRMLEDFCRIFKTEEKCVLKLKPITLKMIKPNKLLVVEVQVEDNICISSISQSESSDGFVKHSLHFAETSSSDKMDKSKIEVERNDSKNDPKKKTPKRKSAEQSSTFTAIKKGKPKPEKQIVIVKQETQPGIFTETNMSGSQGNNNDSTAVENENDLEDCNESFSFENSISEYDQPLSNLADRNCESLSLNTSPKENIDITGKVEINNSAKPTVTKPSKPGNEISQPSKDYIIRINEEGKKIYECVVCSKKTKVRQSMEVHLNQHTGNRPYQCEVCGLGFKGPSNLKTHMHQHQSYLKFQCDICHQRFRDRGTCQQHKKRHLGEKNHTCEHCGKSFVISSDLKKHIRTHTGIKPYRCLQCNLQFSDGSSYTRHVRTHARKFQYQCTLCFKQYMRRDNCKKHIKQSHSGSEHVDILRVETGNSGQVDSNAKFNASDINIVQNVVQMNSAFRDQTEITTSTSHVAMSNPVRKSWQNFETLTLEASRRYKEQSSSDNISGQNTGQKFDTVSGTQQLMASGHQEMPASQIVHVNSDQSLLDGQKLATTLHYDLQTMNNSAFQNYQMYK